VIALDDGSTDETPAILRDDPLVRHVLSNPVRPGYEGWNDRENRQRLLDACAEFHPFWILWLDADEFIVPSDQPLLRRFLRDAATDLAYGFEVLRLIGDEHHYDRGHLWVYRLFRYHRDCKLPNARFHFEPIPTEITPDCWRRTRMRIAHLASLTASDRRQRYDKYRAADPNREWQQDYSQLLAPPGHLWKVRPLPVDLPLLMDDTVKPYRCSPRS
jgi:GT2 family glycosyltransferase